MSLEVRMQADDFFHAYRVIKESNDAAIDNLGNLAGKPLVSKSAFGVFPTMSPGIVCLAFSVELYLKDLHFALGGKPPPVHNLFDLYWNLPKRIRREIYAHDSISQNPWAMREPIFVPPRFTGASRCYYGFLQQIRAISDGFQKWRYSYESTALSYPEWFALAFVEAVKSAAYATKARSLRS